MNTWREIREDYLAWLRSFPMLAHIGQPRDMPEVVDSSESPAYLDVVFWSERTHEAEWLARRHLSDTEIDGIFEQVTSIIDEDLLRFDPLVAYYGHFFPDGDATRIEVERSAAHSVKRDLAWAGIERTICERGFFSGLINWYDQGRWPIGWTGKYPAGHVRVI